MKSKFLFLFACSLLFMVSCSTPPPVEDSEILSTAQVDGKEMFKTIFFSIGDAAEKIPSFKENIALLNTASEEHPEFMQDYIANVESYIVQIEKHNPEYFDQLQKAIYAQDFVEIKRVMQLGDLLLLPTVVLNNLENIRDENLKREIMALDIESVNFRSEENLRNLTDGLLTILSRHGDEFESLDINEGRCLWFAAVGVVTFAVAGNFVYFVNVAWTGNLNWNVNWNIPLQSTNYDYDSYLGEELIKDIAFGFNR